jgi:hypothetical protein
VPLRAHNIRVCVLVVSTAREGINTVRNDEDLGELCAVTDVERVVYSDG